jgi:hypothetical protein
MRIYVEIAVGLARLGYCGSTAGDIFLSTVPPGWTAKNGTVQATVSAENMTQPIKLELEISFRRRC